MGRFADLSGKVAIVTGGAVGIGGAIGSVLAENGVSVAVVDKDPVAAEKKAAELVTLDTDDRKNLVFSSELQAFARKLTSEEGGMIWQ